MRVIQKTVMSLMLATTLFAVSHPDKELSSFEAHPCGDFDGDGSVDLIYIFEDKNNSSAGDVGGYVIYSYKKGESLASGDLGYWGVSRSSFCFSNADLDGDGDAEVIVMDKVYNWSGGTTNSGN